MNEEQGYGCYLRKQRSAGLFTLPEFVWELFLGIYLTFKGFKPSPMTSGETRQVGMN